VRKKVTFESVKVDLRSNVCFYLSLCKNHRYNFFSSFAREKLQGMNIAVLLNGYFFFDNKRAQGLIESTQ
jgi:hypothetical protein